MGARVLVAGLFHETHTFLEGTTALQDCQILRGEELHRTQGDASPFSGFWEAARQFNWEVVPVLDVRATPGPMVEEEIVETWWREFQTVATAELAKGVHAIYLVLHGAMVSPACTDVEGELLERIRLLPGAENILIGGVFDLHANFTARMARHSNCLVAYRENPHTDGRESAVRAAALLERALQNKTLPRTFWVHPPLVWPPTGTATAQEPMLSLERLARQIEAEHGNIWAVNVLAGFAFADIPETGVSFSVVTVGSESEAAAALERLQRTAWEKKDLGNVIDLPLQQAMEKMLPLPPGLTVVVEPADNIGGGAPGDGTSVLQALVEHGVANAAIAINDPAAVAHMEKMERGERCKLSIGGKGSRLAAGPVLLEVELISRHQGRFKLEDQQSHLASMSGEFFDMGPCAVVRHVGILILLTSRKTPPFDLGQWRSQGIDPGKLSLIVVKAAVAHRRAYNPIASRQFSVATPGPCTSQLQRLPYQKISRPVAPLDAI